MPGRLTGLSLSVREKSLREATAEARFSFMAMSALSEEIARRRPKTRRFGVGPLFMAFAAQGVVLLLALFVVVIQPIFQAEPDFTAKKTIYLPQRELEHRMAVSEFQAAAQPPVMLNKLTSSALVSNTVPPLPSMPQIDYKPVEMESPLTNASALLGQSGLMGGLSGISTETSSFAFFGLEESATKVVICFDISTTVKNRVESAGYSMEKVRDATKEVIEQLNPNTLFGFIQFARNYDMFRPYLVAATKANKEAAIAWLDAEFRTDGMAGRGWRRDNPNGIQSVVKAAFAMDPEPDVVIILSDGGFWRTFDERNERVPWADLMDDLERFQAVMPDPARLHFIGFQMRATDKTGARRLVNRWRGRLREID